MKDIELVTDSYYFNDKQIPDPEVKIRNRILIHINFKRRIRIALTLIQNNEC